MSGGKGRGGWFLGQQNAQPFFASAHFLSRPFSKGQRVEVRSISTRCRRAFKPRTVYHEDEGRLGCEVLHD